MRALGELVAILLVGTVMLLILRNSLIRPWQRRRKIERLRQENERLDDLIRSNRK